MRPIKYRAWYGPAKKFVYFSVNEANQLVLPEKGINNEFLGPWQQFTGLLDSKGKEIYESDVLKLQNNPLPFTVGWNKYFWEITTKVGHNAGLALHEQFEIIGNVHENPELIK